jgi:hypothetical protein
MEISDWQHLSRGRDRRCGDAGFGVLGRVKTMSGKSQTDPPISTTSIHNKILVDHISV